MIVAIHQPNYIPGTSYFFKMMHSDIFIILDSVPFSKENWTNRNRIKGPQGEQMITVPVLTKGRLNQKITEVEIDSQQPWHRKHYQTLMSCYGSAPFFRQYAEFMRSCYSEKWASLCDLNVHAIRSIAGIAGINSKLIRSSELPESGLAGTELLIHLIKEVGGSTYLSGPGGRKYMETDLFPKNGICLAYSVFEAVEYRQRFFGPFIPNLSILDLLFNEGGGSVRTIRESGRIIYPVTEGKEI
ncbi:MAG: WbqC family protein [Nitrospiraceae bacterium]|nr:WbqC family protein [Nitrospiraceae bacterium]